ARRADRDRDARDARRLRRGARRDPPRGRAGPAGGAQRAVHDAGPAAGRGRRGEEAGDPPAVVMSVAPVTASVTVPAPPEQAFAAFTERFGDWWPREYTWSHDVLE